PLLSTRYAGRNPYTVYLVDLFVTPPGFLELLYGRNLLYTKNSQTIARQSFGSFVFPNLSSFTSA
ncbi:hypothetical protein QUA31_09680, partial [Microcoleus sp. Pol14D5]|uniref:hypothetical protein n=1 Tax=unclassified Microcoleus TaxID=2642155 RepID=UPI002FD0FFF5